MSKITSTDKIAVEDFKEQKSWIEKLLNPINQFMQDALQILNSGITLRDNLIHQEYEISLPTDGVRTTVSFSFKWNQKQVPTFVFIAQLVESASLTCPAVGFAWQYANGSLTCSLTGLSASKDYTLKVKGIV